MSINCYSFRSCFLSSFYFAVSCLINLLPPQSSISESTETAVLNLIRFWLVDSTSPLVIACSGRPFHTLFLRLSTARPESESHVLWKLRQLINANNCRYLSTVVSCAWNGIDCQLMLSCVSTVPTFVAIIQLLWICKINLLSSLLVYSEQCMRCGFDDQGILVLFRKG